MYIYKRLFSVGVVSLTLVVLERLQAAHHKRCSSDERRDNHDHLHGRIADGLLHGGDGDAASLRACGGASGHVSYGGGRCHDVEVLKRKKVEYGISKDVDK